MGAEYRVVVLIGKLNSNRCFAKIETTTNPEDLSQLSQKIESDVEQFEFDNPVEVDDENQRTD